MGRSAARAAVGVAAEERALKVLLSIGAAKKRRGISGNWVTVGVFWVSTGKKRTGRFHSLDKGLASIQGLRCPSQGGLNSSVHGTKRIICA